MPPSASHTRGGHWTSPSSRPALPLLVARQAKRNERRPLVLRWRSLRQRHRLHHRLHPRQQQPNPTNRNGRTRMSTDLTKLIDRIADAGGPINLRDHDEWEAHLDGRRGLAVLWTPEELRPRTSAEALLIHAFKQEFEWRGWTWTARV